MAIPYPKLEPLLPVTSDYTIKVTETTASATVTVLVADTSAGAWGGGFLTNSTTTMSSILRAIGSALTDNATLSGTYSLSVDDDSTSSTGKVTFAVTTGVASFSLVWSTTTMGAFLRSALGFSTDLQAGSASYTGAYASRYIWLPNTGRTEPMGPDITSASTTLGVEDSDLVVTVAPTGSTRVITYSRRQEERMSFRYLLGYKTHVINESTTNESLQTAWQVMQDDGTMTFAYYPDRSVNTTSVALVAQWPRFEPAPDQPGWTGSESLWNVSWNCLKKT